jgi:2-phosphosulfolactate phosphatase
LRYGGLYHRPHVCAQGRQTLRLDDLAFVCYNLYEAHKDDIDALVCHAEHHAFLRKQGMQEDIDYCLQMDIMDALPCIRMAAIVLK